MYAQELPRESLAIRAYFRAIGLSRITTGAPLVLPWVRCVGQEITLALKAQSKRRGDHRMARHWHVVQKYRGIRVEIPRTSSELPISMVSSDATRWSGVNARYTAVFGSAARSISSTATSISPDLSNPCRHTLLPFRYKGIEKPVDFAVRRIGVQLNFKAIREVFTRFVNHYVATRHHEQSLAALKRRSR